MPVFEAVTLVACPPQLAFEFVANPANLALVTPPEMYLEIVDPPLRVALGARIAARTSRYGVKQTLVNEVTRFEEGVGFTDEQVEGPFKKMIHSHRVDAHAGGTQLTDTFDFEAPGGLLGFLVTNDRILSELKTLSAFRSAKYKEHLER